MVIVESESTFEQAADVLATRWTIVIPIFSDTIAHPAVNRLCVLYVASDKETFVLPFNHNDCENLPLSYLNRLKSNDMTNVANKKAVLHAWKGVEWARDVTGIEYLLKHVVKPEEDF